MNKIVMTIDVEDWFNVRNMINAVPYPCWQDCELRVQIGLNYILRVLKTHEIKATFFVLGWIAERVPHLIQRIATEGHEIASHGYCHSPLDLLTPESFRKDLQKSLKILQPLSNGQILGYRAPSFSITRQTFWAFDIMRDVGIQYDSSIFPMRHPDYGIPSYAQEIKNIRGIIELPMTSLQFMGLRLPVSGGGYFRLFPYKLSHHFFKKALQKCSDTTSQYPRAPVVAYFHPWEFDPDQPRMPLPLSKSFRHYTGLASNQEKFTRLARDFEFTSAREALACVFEQEKAPHTSDQPKEVQL